MRSSCLAALLLWSWAAWAQPLPAGRAQDLDFVANQVPKLHANFFFQLKQADFQAAVANLQAKGAAMSNAGFYVGLASLLAMAGDSHTAIYLFESTAAAPYSRALGTRLVEVAGNPMDDVERRLATMIRHANDQWLHFIAAQYLSVQQVLQGLGWHRRRLPFR